MNRVGLTGLLGRFGHWPSVLADHGLDLGVDCLGISEQHVGTLDRGVGTLAEQDVGLDAEPLIDLVVEGIKEHILLIRSQLEGDGAGHWSVFSRLICSYSRASAADLLGGIGQYVGCHLADRSDRL